MGNTSNILPEDATRRRHDLKESVRTLRLAIDEIKSGYRFDDDLGSAKVAVLERSVRLLEAFVSEALERNV